MISVQYILKPEVGITYTIEDDFSQDNKNTLQFSTIQPIDKYFSKKPISLFSKKYIFLLVSSAPCKNSVKNRIYI